MKDAEADPRGLLPPPAVLSRCCWFDADELLEDVDDAAIVAAAEAEKRLLSACVARASWPISTVTTPVSVLMRSTRWPKKSQW